MTQENPPPPGYRATDALIGDYDGDGEADLFFGRDGKVCVATLDGRGGQRGGLFPFVGQDFAPQFVANVEGGRGPGLITVCRAGSNFWISAFNQQCYEIYRLEEPGGFYDLKGIPTPYGAVVAWRYFDADASRPARLLTETQNGYASLPCALRMRVLTNASAAALWEIPMASSGSYMTTADLDGDGFEDFLCGTRAFGTGRMVPDGRTSDESHLLAISHDGSLLWCRTNGAKFVETEAQVYPKTAGDFILVRATRRLSMQRLVGPEWKPEGRLLKLDYSGRQVARWETTNELTSTLVSRLAPNGPVYVLATDSEGCLTIFNAEDLRPQHVIRLVKRRHHWLELNLVGVADLAGDGRFQIILKSADVENVSGRRFGTPEERSAVDYYHDNSVIVLDSGRNILPPYTVSPLFKYNGKFEVQPLKDARTGQSSILVLHDRITVLKLETR